METVLFLVGGSIALIGATIMLFARNAVHSALGLVTTMGALAFLFLLLNAPFLAMIQITVYAGAIMVLFIFVIMLLGADKLDLRERFPIVGILGVTLASALFIAVGLPLLNDRISLEMIQPPPPNPQVRFVHAATDIGNNVAVSLEGALQSIPLASGLNLRDVSTFETVQPGDYQLVIAPEGGTSISTPITLAAGSVQTVVAYGTGDAPQVTVVAEDLSTMQEARSSRVIVFNAYDPEVSISMVNFGSDFDDADTMTYANDIPYGTASEATVLLEGDYDLAFVRGAGAPDVNPGVDNVLAREEGYELDRDQSKLIVLFAEREVDGSIRASVDPLGVMTRPSFGGPRAIGIELFTTYMLPFQLLAVLLLAAMVGAIVLTRNVVGPAKQRTNVRRRVARPLTNVIASQTGHEVTDDAPQLPAETDQRGSGD
jgi:NADH:ubiquinone oxidoreductase subunit 6 (subunit J)